MIFTFLIILSSTFQIVKLQPSSEFNYTLDDGYPINYKYFGSIAAVDVDLNNNVIIFHRGTHKWEKNTFDRYDNYMLRRDAPISAETVVTIDPKEKKVIRAWGSNKFFLPHGLSLDKEAKNVWLTDCALHQVFKYPVDGSAELIVLGQAFIPGSDDSHFCKPTSVADTGEFVFVADGYCNSRIVMFSETGKYLGEFGQAPNSNILNFGNNQPTFLIPHKVVYAREAKLLYVADRENGRIQCFTFDPRHSAESKEDSGLILNGAIRQKYIITNPEFNGRIFSVDYSPMRGGILTVVSGESSDDLYRKPPLGFVYNATTAQKISSFSPPSGQTFGMAHDLAISGTGAESLYVVDITPVNLWRFSRPIAHENLETSKISRLAEESLQKAILMIRKEDHDYRYLWYFFLVSMCIAIILVRRSKSSERYLRPDSMASLYSNRNIVSLNSLFGNNRLTTSRASGRGTLLRAFTNLFNRGQRQENDFSRIPLEDSDNSDGDKSDSDVEEFNINQATTTIKIDV